MLAEAPQFLIDVGTVTGAITAILVFLGLLSRLRPVKWLWKNLVADPFADWMTRHIDEVVQPIKDEMTPNGGGSMKDQVHEIATGQKTIRAEVGGMIRKHEELEMGKIERLEERTSDVERDMASLLDQHQSIHRLAVRIGRWTHNFREFEPVKLHDLDLQAEQDEVDQDLLEEDPP